ncbi:hypothetical protein FXO38_30165 [Capsicum annuum]|nr:hypothetical protein FXO38_30165 [Capsicum annuum]
MMVDDVLVVVGDAISYDGGMVVSIDTVASVADDGGRGGDAGDSGGDGVRECVEVDDVLVVVSDVWKLMMCWWLLVVVLVLVLIDELVGSWDRPVAVDGGGVEGRGVHGSIWKPTIPPLPSPAPPGVIPSMSLQFHPILLAQQAQPYGSRSSQQFLPLGHANVAMSQSFQIQFPQPMQQVTGRPVVGMDSMPQGPPIPQDFQRNLSMSNNHMPGSGGPNLPLSSSYNEIGELAAPLVVPKDKNLYLGETSRADDRNGGFVDTEHYFFISHPPWFYYNKVTRTSKWRMPDQVKAFTVSSMIRRGNILFSWILYSHKVQLFINSLLAHETDTISHPSDFGSISVVKISSPGADGSLFLAYGAKSSPIAVSTAANLQTIMASESSSLSGKNVKKDAAITEITGATPSDEKIVELGPLAYESKAAWRAVINDRRYGALKSLCERKQAFNEYLSQKKKLEAEERRVKQKKAQEYFRIMIARSCYHRQDGGLTFTCNVKLFASCFLILVIVCKAISIFEHDEHFKVVDQAKDREDFFEDYVEKLEKKHAKALEEQKRNRVEYLEFLKSCDFIKASSQWRKVQDRLETDERCSRLEKIDRLEIFQEYIRDLEREEEEQRKLRMIKDFATYLAV